MERWSWMAVPKLERRTKMEKKSESGVVLSFNQVFTLVYGGKGGGEEMFFVADVDKYYGDINRVFFTRSYQPEGYDLRKRMFVVGVTTCLVPSWDIASKKSEWRLERSIWNENVLTLALYHRKESGDKRCLWRGTVFSNRTKADEEDVVAFIERRQKELKKKRK